MKNYLKGLAKRLLISVAILAGLGVFFSLGGFLFWFVFEKLLGPTGVVYVSLGLLGIIFVHTLFRWFRWAFFSKDHQQ